MHFFLAPAFAQPGFDELAVSLIALFALAFGVLCWKMQRALIPREPVTEASPDTSPEVETPAPEPVPAGPGQILTRFQELSQDFAQATKELHSFHGAREVQIQGWQQLSADIVRRMLPVLENLEPYLDDEDATAAEVAQLAYGRLLTELATLGVSRIAPLPGDPFDAKYHQLEMSEAVAPPYRVKDVVAVGYLFRPRVAGAGEIVLKPAAVIVENCPDEKPATEDAVEPAPGILDKL